MRVEGDIPPSASVTDSATAGCQSRDGTGKMKCTPTTPSTLSQPPAGYLRHGWPSITQYQHLSLFCPAVCVCVCAQQGACREETQRAKRSGGRVVSTYKIKGCLENPYRRRKEIPQGAHRRCWISLFCAFLLLGDTGDLSFLSQF